MDLHQHMMRRALALARRGVGRTSPNPAVGCVVVRDGRIVGEGWHRRAGTPHAEVHALREAGDLARGADVYVTLEPCSHHGRTPPCAEALLRAGVAKVYAGMTDPNPLVSGRGAALLTKSGIPVVTGLLEKECRRLNEGFCKHVSTGFPFVVSKSALTLDGKTATMGGDSKWITCERSRKYVHELRSSLDAVMVGVDTVLADDPLLDTRLLRTGRNPLRVVIDSALRTPLDARVAGIGTLFATALPETDAKVRRLQERGAMTVSLPGTAGRVALDGVLAYLGSRGVQSVLLEGGGVLAGEMLRQRLIDRFIIFFALKILGGEGRGAFAGAGPASIAGALALREVRVRRFGEDIMVDGYPEYSCSPD